jgi:hypothetical protein
VSGNVGADFAGGVGGVFVGLPGVKWAVGLGSGVSVGAGCGVIVELLVGVGVGCFTGPAAVGFAGVSLASSGGGSFAVVLIVGALDCAGCWEDLTVSLTGSFSVVFEVIAAGRGAFVGRVVTVVWLIACGAGQLTGGGCSLEARGAGGW